jgi:small subunit ribosomal protein S1
MAKKAVVAPAAIEEKKEEVVSEAPEVAKEPEVKVEKAEKAEKAAPTKKASTMAELLAQSKHALVVPQRGDKVIGTITAKTKKALIIDIGAKTEGAVTDKEFEIAQDYIEELNIGDKIEAVVFSVENDRGQILLSLKRAAMEAKWQRFIDAHANDEILEVKGIDVNKGGLIVLAEGVRGFVPSSQFGKEFIGKYQSLKGKTVSVKVIEVDQEKNRLIFSERHVSEASELAQRDQALTAVKAGDIYSGVVSGVMPFGLFVTVEVPVKGGESTEDGVGHVEGLVHISEISWEKVNDPGDYHKVGDRLDVKVMGVDEDTSKLNLSIKQLSDDPWQHIADSYSVGTTFDGTVTRVEQFGVFVNVEPGVDGLIHNSKLTGEHKYAVGEKVTVSVESVDPAQRRMSLSPVLTEVPVGYK